MEKDTQTFSTGQIEFTDHFLLHLQVPEDNHTVHLIIDSIPDPVAIALVTYIAQGRPYRISWDNRRPGGLNHHVATLTNVLFG